MQRTLSHHDKKTFKLEFEPLSFLEFSTVCSQRPLNLRNTVSYSASEASALYMSRGGKVFRTE